MIQTNLTIRKYCPEGTRMHSFTIVKRRTSDHILSEAINNIRQVPLLYERLQGVMISLVNKAQIRGIAIDARQFHADLTHAFAEANMRHKGVKRKSGEPYIWHIIRNLERTTAADLPFLGIDFYKALCGHDLIEDVKDYTKKTAEEAFGSNAAYIIEGLTKVKTKAAMTKIAENHSYVETFINFIKGNYLIVYAKLADLFDFFNTCEMYKKTLRLPDIKENKEKKAKALERMYSHFQMIDQVIYPMAMHYLGCVSFARRVANFAMSVFYPDTYNRYKKIIDGISLSKTTQIYKTKTQIETRLRESGLSPRDFAVILRKRTPYELLVKYRSNLPKHLRIKDVLYFDVVVKSPEVINASRAAILSYFDGASIKNDFLAGKKNGYKALHMVIGKGANRLLIRIFTEEMSKTNKLGLAYKHLNGGGQVPEILDETLDPEIFKLVFDLSIRDGHDLLVKMSNSRKLHIIVKSKSGRISIENKVWAFSGDRLFDLVAQVIPSFADKVKSYEYDGEKITFQSPEEALQHSIKHITSGTIVITCASNFIRELGETGLSKIFRRTNNPIVKDRMRKLLIPLYEYSRLDIREPLFPTRRPTKPYMNDLPLDRTNYDPDEEGHDPANT